VKAYYDRRAPEYDDWYLGRGKFADRLRPEWEAERTLLIETLEALPPRRTLDVACGTGYLTHHLPGDVTGLDQSERMLREAARQAPEATLVQGDVSVDDQAENVVKAALAFGEGRLDILVNNAGITRDNLLVRMSAEDWDAVVDLNLRGAFLVTKAAMRPMMKQRSGRIVNVSSVAGVAGNAGQANYASAKAGLIGFTRTVAREMAVRNITCNAVAPGFVPTDLTNALLKQMEETILKQIPLGRFGTVEDVANAIAFLVSDEASYITGQVLVVDGGMVTA